MKYMILPLPEISLTPVYELTDVSFPCYILTEKPLIFLSFPFIICKATDKSNLAFCDTGTLMFDLLQCSEMLG